MPSDAAFHGASPSALSLSSSINTDTGTSTVAARHTCSSDSRCFCARTRCSFSRSLAACRSSRLITGSLDTTLLPLLSPAVSTPLLLLLLLLLVVVVVVAAARAAAPQLSVFVLLY